MSLIELLGIVKNLGFPTTINLYHLIPDADMNGGLRMIFGDNDVLDMYAMHAGRETIDVYVDHFFMIDAMNSAPVQINNANAVENTAQILKHIFQLVEEDIYAGSFAHGVGTSHSVGPSYGAVHPKKYKIRGATSTWLANKYMDKLVDDPSWKVKEIQSSVIREFSLFMSRGQSYRAKRKALEVIEGDHKEQFSRMLVMFDAQKKGFLGGSRPVIGLDACHLKGPCGGQLMHAVGRDGNNQMYPLALAVVEIENKDSWMWVLRKLSMPGVEHRFCLRHLYANFKLLFKEKDLEDLIWRAASAYTLEEHREHMNALRVLNQSARD
ncbi:hypothetical protein ACH5RR_021247 [Cinchona calisaya]|uniref:MULE transposase domain-containing protein n=1 Tax=Cinchona calisaya TaxID=153742 RepID=A0ABD2ZLQ6_9GENT